MVQAVDLEDRFSQDVRQAALFVDLDGMGQVVAGIVGIIAMLDGTRVLVGDVFVEGPTKSDIEHLEAAANAQEGCAVINDIVIQVQLELVAVRFHFLNQRMGGTAVAGRIHISPAGEEYTVQAAQQGQ